MVGQLAFLSELDRADLPAIGTPPPAPYVRDSETSREAAEAIARHLGPLQQEVLGALVGAGDAGLTDEELQAVLQMNPSTERPRRIELANAGLVTASEQQRTTQSGRKAVVWVATESGAGWLDAAAIL